MQFSIEKEVFLKALGRVQGIVEKRNTIPILSNVLIEAADKKIRLTATDLEVGMQASYPAEISSAGKITVSAKKLYEIVKELPEQAVNFKAKDNGWIEIRCGKALFNIVGLSPEEFPYFPNPAQVTYLEIPSSQIKEMIEKTSFSISTDESKYNLSGIFFNTHKKENESFLRLVATDGHRLSLIQRKIKENEIPELINGVIFPRKGIFELKKMADESDAIIEIGFMDNNAVVRRDQTVVIMRLVDGEFPDYNRVVPKNNELIVNINRESFLHALRRTSILSSEKSRGIKLNLSHQSLEISSSNPEFGDAREEIEVTYQGPDISIGFNARYLIDILQSLDQDEVELFLKDNLSPGLLQPKQDETYLAVVMPMRL
jgi:DNA polymerase-3 subunit beta